MKVREIGKGFKPIKTIVSVSHTVKFSQTLIGQLLSSLLKSSEKEFSLILSMTYCIGWRETLPPPAYPEWLKSQEKMAVLLAAMDWPPVARAFCQKKPIESNKYSPDKGGREKDDKGHFYVLTLYGQ